MPAGLSRRTLIVTNDFPPRQGGIQSFVHSLALQLADAGPGQLAVYASTYPGAAEFDARQPFRVTRHPTGLLVPTPAATARIQRAAREHRAQAVWFGAAAPLALLAPQLRRAGIQRAVATTHGHEVGWAALPGARMLLGRIGASCDAVTYLGDYTRSRLAPVLGSHPELAQLAPGVDVETYRPGLDASAVLARHGLGRRRVVVCVSRLVPRKGQDALIRALPAIRRRVPEAALLVVGRGPYETELRRLAEREGVGDAVVFTGAVSADELPAHYAAGEVFAMPCRTRRGGLDVEGLGIVYLEASATGLPVVAGRSGGAPDAVRDGETGYVVDGRNIAEVADRIGELLSDPALADRMGRAGRAWVQRDWRWDVVAARLIDLLDG